MLKIKVNELVEFRRKETDRKKINFAQKLKTRPPKEKKEQDKNKGGNHWVTSTSCIYNVIKNNTDKYLDPKIEELEVRLKKTEHPNSKVMFQRNINILNSFKEFNFNEIIPPQEYNPKRISLGEKIVLIKNFPINVDSEYVVSFERNGLKEVGAVWLAPQKDGFKKPELGMFCEMLFRYLQKNYSKNYQIAPDYCIAVDTFNAQKISYTDLLSGDISHLVESTLEEIDHL